MRLILGAPHEAGSPPPGSFSFLLYPSNCYLNKLCFSITIHSLPPSYSQCFPSFCSCARPSLPSMSWTCHLGPRHTPSHLPLISSWSPPLLLPQPASDLPSTAGEVVALRVTDNFYLLPDCRPSCLSLCPPLSSACSCETLDSIMVLRRGFVSLRGNGEQG